MGSFIRLVFTVVVGYQGSETGSYFHKLRCLQTQMILEYNP